jgi:hypothetical protein
MNTNFLSGAILSVSLLLPAATAATAASLTRIETRPFYGAVVTEEEGVRVFRPLPPHRHVIINPDGRTPLNLTIEDRNVVVNHNYPPPVVEGGDGAARYVGGNGAFWTGHRERRHVRRHRAGGHMIHVPSRLPARASGKR